MARGPPKVSGIKFILNVGLSTLKNEFYLVLSFGRKRIQMNHRRGMPYRYA